MIGQVPCLKIHPENKMPLPAHFDEFWYKHPSPRLFCVLDMSFREDAPSRQFVKRGFGILTYQPID
jgi:hypothetical protein